MELFPLLTTFVELFLKSWVAGCFQCGWSRFGLGLRRARCDLPWGPGEHRDPHRLHRLHRLHRGLWRCAEAGTVSFQQFKRASERLGMRVAEKQLKAAFSPFEALENGTTQCQQHGTTWNNMFHGDDTGSQLGDIGM